MDDLEDRVNALMLSGICCTSALVALALEDVGHDNPEFVAKVAVLCGGLWSGTTCGALTGGVLALSILQGDRPADHMTVGHYVDWFRAEFGSIECADLVEEDPMARAVRCPPIAVAAYLKAHELATRE